MINEYDSRIAIVGAGITGLSAAYNLITGGYSGSISIFERNEKSGGRLVSDVLKDSEEVIEYGAGRFNVHHHKEVDRLRKELELEVTSFNYPALYGAHLGTECAEENGERFATFVASLKNEVNNYPTGNFSGFAKEILKGEPLDGYAIQGGYDTLLNPHLPPQGGIAILSDHPESQSYINRGSTNGWFRFKKGFQSLVSSLEDKLKDRVNFFYESELKEVGSNPKSQIKLIFEQKNRVFQTCFDSAIIATPIHQAQRIAGLDTLQSIGKPEEIEDVPLLKGFIKFDRNWWNALGISDCCVIGDSSLRKLYISKDSNIMWFYCDGKSALDTVDKISSKNFSIKREIENHLHCDIPAYAVVEDFGWKFWARGISFFKKQDQSLSHKFGLAAENLIVCSDIYTDHLGWVEGGIMSAKDAAQHILTMK